MTGPAEPAAEQPGVPMPSPCKACPWRLANQGTRHPDGWYSKANLRRLWAKLRRGEMMSCHPTDPGLVLSPKAQEAGYQAAPEHAQVKECVGAHVLTQREFMRFQDDAGADFRAYWQLNPRGLTRTGLAALLAQALFGGTIAGDGAPKLPKPNLNDPEIGFEWVGDWQHRDPAAAVSAGSNSPTETTQREGTRP